MDIEKIDSLPDSETVSINERIQISFTIEDKAILDSDGNPVLDVDSNPIQSSVTYMPTEYYAVRDSNGDPVLDSSSGLVLDSSVLYFTGKDGKTYMSAIKRAYVTLNGQQVVATYDDKTKLWTAETNAPNESSWGQPNHVYTASVTAEDAAGNSTTVDSTDKTYGDQLKFRVLEKTKPTTEIVSPTSNSVLGVNTQNVKVRFKDAGGSGLNEATIVFKVNGTVVPLKDGDAAGYTIADGEGDDAGYRVLTYTATNLPDGANSVEAQITDNDGNASDDVMTNFTISTAAPTLNITSPADNLITNSNKLTVSGQTTAPTDGITIAGVTIKVGDADPISVTPGKDGSFSQEITLPAEGDTTIVITATDSLGKNTAITRHVTLDTTNPVITDITAEVTTVDAGSRIRVTFKVTDA